MTREWITTGVLILTFILGLGALYGRLDNKIDNKFDQLDSRLDGIDARLARVEGWIEGRFEGSSAETTPTSVVNSDSLLIQPQIVVSNN